MHTIASIKGHPIHAMLIAFPIAFLVGGFVADLAGWWGNSAYWWQTAGYLILAGIVMAIVAAVPGMIDYLYSVPPKSSARSTATWHMITNLVAVGIFIVSWIIRMFVAPDQQWLVTLLDLVGLSVLGGGGWLGGTLVHEYLIGPRHMYAGGGKWRELSISEPTGDGIEVGSSDDLKVDQMMLLKIGDQRIVLARSEEGYYAFQDHCSHQGGSLADGVMACGKVQCLWHGSQFDVRSGEVRSGPAKTPLATYRVETVDGKLRLYL